MTLSRNPKLRIPKPVNVKVQRKKSSASDSNSCASQKDKQICIQNKECVW